MASDKVNSGGLMPCKVVEQTADGWADVPGPLNHGERSSEPFRGQRFPAPLPARIETDHPAGSFPWKHGK